MKPRVGVCCGKKMGVISTGPLRIFFLQGSGVCYAGLSVTGDVVQTG